VERTEEAQLRRRLRAAFPHAELVVLARTTSTQDVVGRAARAGAAEGYCCLTDEQTAGRGRQQRSWAAPAGSSLLSSVLLRPSPPAPATLVPIAAGVALVEALAGYGFVARLKWPNDVLLADRKVAGILAESRPSAEGMAIVLGVGVNLTVQAFPEGVDATSLHRHGDAPSPARLLGSLLERLRSRLDDLELGRDAAVLEAWRGHATGLGAMVSVSTAGGHCSGIARDLDHDGALLLDTDEGTVRLLAGDVHLER
jgi:BirA family biotin operon repressor/biotin-[acetyl-CoA-carboxylase] ligase